MIIRRLFTKQISPFKKGGFRGIFRNKLKSPLAPFFQRGGLLAACICFCTFAQAAANKPILDIQNWQTSQGTPVYFVRAPELPMMDLKIIFTAGSAYDDAQWGLANLTASMLGEGSKNLTADQIAAQFDQTGAQFDANTNRDVTVVSLRSLTDPKYLTPALQTFNEVLGQPTFSDQSLVRVKQQTLSAIQSAEQNPSAVAADTFYQYLYPNHPYGHPVLGMTKTVNTITRNQVQTFYQHYFVSTNAKIILVGDLDRKQAEQIAEQAMQALAKGAPAPTLAMNQAGPHDGMHAVEFPSQQTTIVAGQLGIDRQNTQYFPLMVGNYMLGAMPLGSLLFEQVRNQRGLAYNVSSVFSPMTYRGPFVVILQTRAAEKQQALNVTEQVLQQFVGKGPNPEQLQLAKQNIVNHFPLNLATNDQIASALMQMALNQRPLNYLDTYRDQVNAVTADQVKQAFQSVIAPDKLLVVTVGPK